MSDYKEKLTLFETLLSPITDSQGDVDCIIDLPAFQSLCLGGIPDKAGIRQKSWKILLGYLPSDKRKWDNVLSEQRNIYYNFVRDLLLDPYSGENPSIILRDHPLNNAPDSKWSEYFHENTILEQIDKDVRRTLSDLSFFQLTVPASPLSPLCPQLSLKHHKKENSAGRSSVSNFSIATIETEDQSIDFSDNNQNDTESLTSVDSINPPSPARKVVSPRTSIENSIRVEHHTIPFSLQSNPSAPIKSRRSIFRRIAHMNKEFGRQKESSVGAQSRSPTYESSIIDEEYEQDLHWEAIERILFIYAKLNPGIGYIQGMNEILGPIYYVMANDSNEEGRAHAEADSFFCFTLLMGEVRDFFVRTMDTDLGTGIGAQMKKLNMRLREHDMELWENMESKALDPMFYSFRWLTCLCSQEFPLPEVIRLWDSAFADNGNGLQGLLEFLVDFCCAMIICQREEIIQGNFADNVKLLQNYPLQDTSGIFHKTYELRQARLSESLRKWTTEETSEKLDSSTSPEIFAENESAGFVSNKNINISWKSGKAIFSLNNSNLPAFKSPVLSNIRSGSFNSWNNLKFNASLISPQSSPITSSDHPNDSTPVEKKAQHLSETLPETTVDKQINHEQTSSLSTMVLQDTSLDTNVAKLASNLRQRATQVAATVQANVQHAREVAVLKTIDPQANFVAYGHARERSLEWMRKVGQFVNNTHTLNGAGNPNCVAQESVRTQVDIEDKSRRKIVTRGIIVIDGVEEQRTIEVLV